MKWYLITKGLRQGTDVKKEVHLDRPENYNHLLAIVKTYIKYEEKVYADNLNKIRKEEPAAESSKKPFHDKKKEGKGPDGLFTKYIPLSMSKEKILAEISVAGLKDVGVKLPKHPS